MGSTASVYHVNNLHEDSHEEDDDSALSPRSHGIRFRSQHTGGTAPSGAGAGGSRQRDKKHIEKNVNLFLQNQINNVSQKIADDRRMGTSKSVPKLETSNGFENLRHSISSTPLMTKSMSVRAHALKQHSRQKNTYISVSSLRFSMAGVSINKDKSNDGASGNSLGNENIIIDPATSKQNQENPIKKKFNLKLQINDEDDWIQVDDDDNDIMTPRVKKDALGRGEYAEQSYTLTQSGTIFVNGFGEGIGKNGIAIGSKYQSKLPMKERLVFLCPLGQGASSTVYKALDLAELRLVAVKMVPVFDRTKRRQMVRELNTLFDMLRKKEKEFSLDHSPSATDYHVQLNFDLKSRKNSTGGVGGSDGRQEHKGSEEGKVYSILSHHYIVDFYDAFSNLEEGGVALMMEYMDGGSLQDIADSGGCADEDVLANIAVQALAGLDFLHKCNQIHRDIKPANLLINLDGDVKVSDLGILRQIEPEIAVVGAEPQLPVQEISKLHRAHTFVGTTTYMAPERIDGQEYSYSSDIWSFGLSMMTLSLGRLPFDTGGGFWHILQCVRDSAPPRLPNNGQWSPEYCDFITQCLQHNPDDRPTASQLLTHPFLMKAFPEEAENMEQIGVEELKSIVKALYSHLETLRNDSIKSLIQSKISAREALERIESTTSISSSTPNTPDPTSASIALNNNLPSAFEMANLILFGEKPTGMKPSPPLTSTDRSQASNKSEALNRFKHLAKQLHVPSPIALHIARSTLLSLIEDNPNSISTPKSKHSNILQNKRK